MIAFECRNPFLEGRPPRWKNVVNRIAVFLGTFLIFLAAANAKFIKVRAMSPR